MMMEHSRFANIQPNLFIFGSIVSATRLASSTIDKYTRSVTSLFHFTKKEFDLAVTDIKLPFEEDLLWFYFAHSATQRNKMKGVLVFTMKSDLSGFQYYCHIRIKPIPIKFYTHLELFFDSIRMDYGTASSGQIRKFSLVGFWVVKINL